MEYDRGDPTAAKRRDTAEDSLNTIDELIAQTEASMKELDIMVNNNSSSSSNATASSDGASEENSSTLSWIKSTIFGINQTKQLSEHLKKTQQELLKMLDQQRQLIAQQQQQQPSSSPSPRTFI